MQKCQHGRLRSMTFCTGMDAAEAPARISPLAGRAGSEGVQDNRGDWRGYCYCPSPDPVSGGQSTCGNLISEGLGKEGWRHRTCALPAHQVLAQPLPLLLFRNVHCVQGIAMLILQPSLQMQCCLCHLQSQPMP